MDLDQFLLGYVKGFYANATVEPLQLLEDQLETRPPPILGIVINSGVIFKLVYAGTEWS